MVIQMRMELQAIPKVMPVPTRTLMRVAITATEAEAEMIMDHFRTGEILLIAPKASCALTMGAQVEYVAHYVHLASAV